MNFKGKMCKKSGITLISLVVTIIILLILAGITIAMLTGENGILTKAQEANLNMQIAEEKEAIGIAYNSVMLEYIESNVTAEKLQLELTKNGRTDIKNVEGVNLITVEFDSGRKYKIDSNGKIIGPISSQENDTEIADKTSLWLGDSLMRGWGNTVDGTSAKGFPEYFKELTGSKCLNSSFSGATITDNTSNALESQDPMTLKEQIEYAISRDDVVNPLEIDFIVLDGGGNDVIAYELYQISKDYQKDIGIASDLTSDTVINDFREVINMLKEKFPNVPILYIQPMAIDRTCYELIVFETCYPNKTLEELNEQFSLNYSTMQELRGFAFETRTDMKSVVDAMCLRSEQLYKEILTVCSELGVEYIDFNDVIVDNRSTDGSDTNSYIQEDQKHFTDEAYKAMIPIIVEKIKSIL